MSGQKQKNIFASNLLRYMQEANKSQKEVANAIHESPQAVNTWCQAIAMPRIWKIEALADYFGVAKSDLLEEKTYDSRQEIKGVSIPVVGVVAAGIPIEAEENIIDYEEISKETARRGDFFALRIKGDSMEPVLTDQDTVIVRKQQDAETGDIVVALVNGDDGCCKRLIKYEWGIQLLSYNQKYEPMVFSNEEISTKPVSIVGKVIESRRKF